MFITFMLFLLWINKNLLQQSSLAETVTPRQTVKTCNLISKHNFYTIAEWKFCFETFVLKWKKLNTCIKKKSVF